MATLDEALGLIPARARIVAAQGCGAPTMLLNALAPLSRVRPGLHLLTGLQIGEQAYLSAVADGTLRYTTWHVTRPSRPLVAAGVADHLPLRLSDVPALLPRIGVDVALLRVSPPDADGQVSLGASTSSSMAAIDAADVVLGEIDPLVPRTGGASRVAASRFDALVESDQPMPIYRVSEPDDVSRRIAGNLLEFVPERPTLQLGIGQVPEAVADELLARRISGLRFIGLGVERLVDLAEADLIGGPTKDTPPIACVELMGSSRLMAFADANPLLGMYPSTMGHDPQWLAARFERIVSINSAVEVDLLGQVNSEMAGGTQLSAVGGSMDFVAAARACRDGVSIIALPSTTSRGKSRIVPRLSADVVATIPRHSVQIVVTEHGAADLRGRTVSERAEALIAIADPDGRDDLRHALATA